MVFELFYSAGWGVALALAYVWLIRKMKSKSNSGFGWLLLVYGLVFSILYRGIAWILGYGTLDMCVFGAMVSFVTFLVFMLLSNPKFE